jgi:glycosyl-4,4'-diaponeurosporenoate acyltransferase
VRVVHLPDAVTVLLDVVAWGVVHAGTGYLAHRLPVRWLERDRWLWRQRRWERDGRLYSGPLRIRRWKDRLPEAGAVFAGGVSKRHVPGGDEGGYGRFVVETRRAEVGHVLAMLPGPLFVLWNPPVAAVIMLIYGVGVNLPFVAIQRYNRIRAGRILLRSSGSGGAGGTATTTPGPSPASGDSTSAPGPPTAVPPGPPTSVPPGPAVDRSVADRSAASRSAARPRRPRDTTGTSMP